MDLTELSRRPISSEAPAGCDARHEPEFEALQTEVDKLSCPSTAGSVDWDSMARLSSAMLRDRSKDMLAAGYLCLALVHTRAYSCTAALSFYLEFLENFWDDLYPPLTRPGSRMRALTWWLDRMKSALTTLPSPLAGENTGEIRGLLSRLDCFLSEKLDQPPALAPLLDYFVEAAPEEPVSQEASAAGPAHEDAAVDEAASQPAPAAPNLALQLPLLEESWESLSQVLPGIITLLFRLREEEPANPLPYRLLRQITWSSIASLPQAEAGRTRIPGPPAHLKQAGNGPASGQDAGTQVLAAERWLPQFIFWLDLNRRVAKAMEVLGSDYQAARDAVCQETAFMLYRLPGLADLCFADGTPFAAPETRLWLQSIAVRKASPATVAASLPTSCAAKESGNQVGPEDDEVQRLIAKGRLEEGMAAGRRALQRTASGRDNLRYRLSISAVLLDNGHEQLALPLLEQAREEIFHHRLEQYEPAVALDGLRLSWLALSKRPEPSANQEAQALLHRIGRLDLAAMAHLLLAPPVHTGTAQTGTAQP